MIDSVRFFQGVIDRLSALIRKMSDRLGAVFREMSDRFGAVLGKWVIDSVRFFGE